MRARSLADAGYPYCPYGAEVWLPSGAVFYLQVVGVSPAAAPDGTPRDDVAGPLLPQGEPVTLPDGGPTELVLLERWVAWRITAARCPLLREVTLFQDRDPRGSVPHGLGVTCWSGARLWIYFRHATPAGRNPATAPVWRAQPTV